MISAHPYLRYYTARPTNGYLPVVCIAKQRYSIDTRDPCVTLHVQQNMPNSVGPGCCKKPIMMMLCSRSRRSPRVRLDTEYERSPTWNAVLAVEKCDQGFGGVRTHPS